MPAHLLAGTLAALLLATSLWGSVPALAQSAPAPQALLDAAWNAADWPAALAVLATMEESEPVLARIYRGRMNYGWELLAAGDCSAAYGQFELALGLAPGDADALRGLTLARQRCPEAVLGTPTRTADPTIERTTIPTAQPTPAPQPTPITPQPVSAPTTYTIQRGDTLYSIAQRYGLTVAELQQANNLADIDIWAGQTLTIPPPSATPGGEGASSEGDLVVHTVQPGETLYRIAQRYGSTPLAIQAANGLASAHIWAGQRLVIPPSTASEAEGGARHHTVKQGETLYALASHYGVTVQELRAANGLADDRIVAGTVLVIP